MRHRRRPAFAVASLGLCVLLASAGQAVATEPASEQAGPSAAAAATRLTASNFRYTLSETSSSLVGALDSALPNVTMGAVADDANRTPSCGSAPSVTHRTAYYCWNDGDQDTAAWYPQGITTSSDAYGAGTYDGKRLNLVSWYDHAEDGIDKGVRISVSNLSASASAPPYRHILLVEPSGTTSAPSYRPVNIHAGGIMWYGNLLYVADTSGGFRVFDLDHLWRVSTGRSSAIGRQADGSYHAFDYKYVLPQTAKFTDSTAGGYAQLQHSSVALDRTSSPDSVIVSEYRSPSAVDAGAQVRTIRVPIDYTNRYLKAAADGIIKATEAYRTDLESVQGSTAINGEFFFSQSDGSNHSDPNSDGDLHTFAAPSGPIVRHGNALTVGAEDLSYDPTRDYLWSLGEYPGYRWVYAADASSF
ncbi:hypothetical protein [Promicromonospora iranensis]|uniref:Secreted protein n=1 Tax=Promicromonospora iranensis TaxID=1105144 RepID=A0ABU2CJ12_9MICO|nr:hypothetical protein [Promicromonospora iranensis]MDR7381334.1 hypothetical protein [Promicromonospora iranensis]